LILKREKKEKVEIGPQNYVNLLRDWLNGPRVITKRGKSGRKEGARSISFNRTGEGTMGRKAMKSKGISSNTFILLLDLTSKKGGRKPREMKGGVRGLHRD